jgi:hypothetical protein
VLSPNCELGERNLVQRVVFGPPDLPGSLRPLRLHGPPAWIGEPGHPNPGWLHILATAVLVVLAGGWVWGRQARMRNPSWKDVS